MAIDTRTLYHRLQKVEDEIQKLNNTLFALKATDIRIYNENFEELSIQAALRAESIACQMRNLICLASASGKSMYLPNAAKVQGIDIKEQAGILTLTLPGLFPKRNIHTNAAFLHEPLNYILQEYVKQNPLPLYRNCVVCFSLVYDKMFSQRRIRDYDNLEFKQILDTISPYVLTDDSGLFCDSYYTTELGESDYTLVSIMDQTAFPAWLRNQKKHIETISETS